MRPNHEYCCACTWQMNGINKTATSDRLDHCWQLDFQWHRRGIGLIFKSLDCFTMRLFHSTTSSGWLPGWRVLLFFYFFVCVCLTYLSYNVLTIWCRILISRPPRVFRRFKRRSCCLIWFLDFETTRAVLKNLRQKDMNLNAIAVFCPECFMPHTTNHYEEVMESTGHGWIPFQRANEVKPSRLYCSLRWRHNGRDCLLNRLFGRRSK